MIGAEAGYKDITRDRQQKQIQRALDRIIVATPYYHLTYKKMFFCLTHSDPPGPMSAVIGFSLGVKGGQRHNGPLLILEHRMRVDCRNVPI